MDNLISMFSYSFMVKALIAIILLAIILPLIGVNITSKKLTMISDTLSHTSLCGVAIGLASSFFPIYMAIIISIIGGIIIETIRIKFPKYSQIALALVLSASIGICGILTKYTSSNKLESFLFGSIFTISNTDLIILGVISILNIIYFIFTYKINLYIGYSQIEAKVSGIKVSLFNYLNIIIISSTIAISSIIIGSMLVTSLLVIPVACGLKLTKKYSSLNIVSIIISLFIQLSGLIVSYYLDINTGGTIILIGISLFFIILIVQYILKKIHLKRLFRN